MSKNNISPSDTNPCLVEFGEAALSWFVAGLNSSFGTALLGAFFGAFAANYFAKRNERNQRLLEQLQASNAACSFSIATAQHALGFKEQLALPITTKFEEDRARYVQFLHQQETGESSAKTFELEYDFRNVELFQHNAPEIERLLVNRAGASQKSIMAATFLAQTLNSLEKAVVQRKEELNRLSGIKPNLSDDDCMRAYFGVPDSAGNVDERLADSTRAIATHLDSTIYFSMLISKELSQKNARLAAQIGRGAPNPIRFKFDQDKIAHLLPDPEEFKDWN